MQTFVAYATKARRRRFLASMRDLEIVGASHEPDRAQSPSAVATKLKLRSSRRKEALIDFGFRISDFGFGVISLLASDATSFMRRAGAGRGRRGGHAPRRQSVHRKRRDPGREIGVDGPTAVVARRGEQKLNSHFRHGMIHLSAARQTHHHETGQRRGFEETAARRLNVRQNLERSFSREISDEPREWISRWKMMMPGLADGDERGQGIAHDGQVKRGEELVWQRRKFKRQRQHALPRGRTRAESPAQRARCENRHRERPVFAVAFDDRGRDFVRTGSSGALCQPAFRPFHDALIFVIGPGHDAERRPAQRRGADVAEAERGVTPAAVGVDVLREPIETPLNAEWGVRSAE